MQIKRYTHKLLKSLIKILSVFMWIACADEHGQSWTPQGGEEATITFTLQLPGRNSPVTRALSEKDENEVTDIHVLVFKPNAGEYVYTARCSGSNITTDTENIRLKTFTVKLRQGTFDIAIAANAREEIESTSLNGLSKEEALAKLKVVMPADGKWPVDTFKPFPMWGNVGDITISENTNLTGDNSIELTRMVARVDVQVSDEAKNHFQLTSVDVYNYQPEGKLVKGMPITSVPIEGPITYDGSTVNATQNLCAGEIYLFEAENHSDAEHTRPKALADRTCVVVGGIWDATGSGDFSGGTTYYRVDFSKNEGTSQTFLDVSRNHHYLFDITKVSGPGHEESNTAFLSDPVHIEVEVLQWDDAELGEIVFNGQNYLSVNPGLFEFSSGERLTGTNYDDNLLYVKTDYKTTATGSQSGWYVERIVDATNESTEVGWLTLTPREGSPDVKTKVTLTFDENTGSETRSAIVILAAGRLRYLVRVTQLVTPEIGLKIYDPISGTPLEILHFEAGVGVTPEEQRFKVDWAPNTSALFISIGSMGTQAFPSGGTTGTPVTATINDGTGALEYVVRPPAIYATEIDPSTAADPFLSKVSTVNFSLSDGVNFISKSIMLRQSSYNLFAEYNTPGYVLNGLEYIIPVKSNSSWKVSAVTGSTEILADVNAILQQTGGNNTTTGSPLRIKTIPLSTNGNNDGKIAYITLEEVDGKCPPFTIAFKGLECGTNGIGYAMTIGTNGYDNTGDGRKTYLTHMYGNRCWMVQNSKEGNPTETTYPGTEIGERGYYYNYEEAVNACPEGWRLPNLAESGELEQIIDGENYPGINWWSENQYMAGDRNHQLEWKNWNQTSRWIGIDGTNSVYIMSIPNILFNTVISPHQTTMKSSVRCIRK